MQGKIRECLVKEKNLPTNVRVVRKFTVLSVLCLDSECFCLQNENIYFILFNGLFSLFSMYAPIKYKVTYDEFICNLLSFSIFFRETGCCYKYKTLGGHLLERVTEGGGGGGRGSDTFISQFSNILSALDRIFQIFRLL